MQKTHLFDAIFSTKTIDLPRQARDKVKETLKTMHAAILRWDAPYPRLTVFNRYRAAWGSGSFEDIPEHDPLLPKALLALQVKLIFGVFLMLKTIILPRQARDKDRENSKRDYRFSQGASAPQGVFGYQARL